MYGQPYMQNSYNQQAPNSSVVSYQPQQNITFSSSPGHATTTTTSAVPSQMNMSAVMTASHPAGYSLTPSPAYQAPFNPSAPTTSSSHHQNSTNPPPPTSAPTTAASTDLHHPTFPSHTVHSHVPSPHQHRSHHHPSSASPLAQQGQTGSPQQPPPQPWSFTQNNAPMQNAPPPMHTPQSAAAHHHHHHQHQQQQQHMMLSDNIQIAGPNAPTPVPPHAPMSTFAGVGEVSAVLHFRNVDANVAQMSIETFVQRFGQIKRLVMLRQKHQALIEMGNVRSAQDVIEAIRETGFAEIDGTRVYIRYSTHQELTSIQQPSCILFVSMQSNDYDLTSAAVDPEIIYSIFSKYGRIRKLVIVSKGERGTAGRHRHSRLTGYQSGPQYGGGVQALVQFHSTEDAEYVKRVLQGQPVTLGNSVNLFLDIQFSRMADLKVINPATSLLVDEQGHVSRPAPPPARVSPMPSSDGRGASSSYPHHTTTTTGAAGAGAGAGAYLGPGCPSAATNSSLQHHHHHHHHHIQAPFVQSNMNPPPPLTMMTQGQVPQQLYAASTKPNHWE